MEVARGVAGGAGPDLVRQMARDVAEDDLVLRESVAHMPHELKLVDHARLLGEWRDLLGETYSQRSISSLTGSDCGIMSSR